MIPSKPLLVALANDYDLVVEGLAAMLAPYWHRISVVELDGKGVPVDPVDVLLYDTFGHEHGLASVIAASEAKLVVVYTWAGTPAMVSEAVTAGASGYLAKGLGAAGMVDALERVHLGEIVVDAGERAINASPGENWPGHYWGLSPREGEIIAWIATGLSNQEVADRAYLSINTVKTYIRTAYQKMDVDSRSKAIIWAIGHDMVPTARPAPDWDDRPDEAR